MPPTPDPVEPDTDHFNLTYGSIITQLLSKEFRYGPSTVKTAILANYSNLLKTNFENRTLWLTFGLTLSLSRQSHSALQAFIECMRIDETDPLPAMLAAKIALEDLDSCEKGLDFARESIERCKRISQTDQSSSSSSPINQYKNITPILSKCYLLASIIHHHIYERKPQSMRKFYTLSFEESKKYLDLAIETYQGDYLVYFHKASQNARRRAYSEAIEDLRRAIKLNPSHLPSIRLLILSLSAVGLLEDALVLCESTINDFDVDFLLLYIRCHLEKRLVETKGYKSALATAQHMLECIRLNANDSESSNGTASTATLTATHMNTPTSNLNTVTQTNLSMVTPTVTLTTPTSTVTDPIVTASDIVKHQNLHQQQLLQQALNLFARDEVDHESGEFMTDALSVWLLVAEIFVKIGSFDDAEMCVDEAANHTNQALCHKIMFIRGLIAKAKNCLILAKSYFQSCLALCPRHARALQQIAHVHYLLGNHSIAEKFLRDSLDIDRNNPKSWDYLRLVHIEQNQRERAKKCELELELLDNNSPVIPLSAISPLTLE